MTATSAMFATARAIATICARSVIVVLSTAGSRRKTQSSAEAPAVTMPASMIDAQSRAGVRLRTNITSAAMSNG